MNNNVNHDNQNFLLLLVLVLVVVVKVVVVVGGVCFEDIMACLAQKGGTVAIVLDLLSYFLFYIFPFIVCRSRDMHTCVANHRSIVA